MNKRLLLLAGVLTLGATVFAEEAKTPETTKISNKKIVETKAITGNESIEGLAEGRQTGDGGFSGTYSAELAVGMTQGGGRSEKKANGNYLNAINDIEWTIADGKLNMGKIGLLYSVERDYYFDKDWNKTSEGWDNSFGLDYQGGKFDMVGREWTFNPSLTYDFATEENFTSKSASPSKRDSETKRLVQFNPKLSTTTYGFATDISPIIAYDDITGTVAFQLDITNFRQLNDAWSTYGDIYFDFAGTKSGKSVKKGEDDTYKNEVFSGNIDGDNKFAFSIEQYLGYEKKVIGNVFFVNELGLEAYSLLQSDKSQISLYAKPELQYRAKLGSATITPYINYTAYTATGDYAAGKGSEFARDELSVGVRFGAKF